MQKNLNMPRIPYNHIYQIILTNNGKQTRVLAHSKSEVDIMVQFKKLLKDSENVMFPIRHTNNGKINKTEYELFVIKKKEKRNEDHITSLKDYYGSIVDYETDNKKWIILDRDNYDIEETFWVFGYDKFKDRKDFNWILNNILYTDNNINNIKRIIVFQNKLLVEASDKMDMILCKNGSDCIRLYNELQKKVFKDKLDKFIFFMGDGFNSKLKKTWYEKMEKLTGWSRRQLNRNALKT